MRTPSHSLPLISQSAPACRGRLRNEKEETLRSVSSLAASVDLPGRLDVGQRAVGLGRPTYNCVVGHTERSTADPRTHVGSIATHYALQRVHHVQHSTIRRYTADR